jgi:hypothetical protein
MSPFSFPANSQEGSRAQVTCSVTSGDLPIYISWLKDGEPLPSSLRVSIKLLVKFVYIYKDCSIILRALYDKTEILLKTMHIFYMHILQELIF